MLLAWTVGDVVRSRAAGWGLVDRPGGHKQHRQPVPLGGGLAIWLAVVLPLASLHAVVWLVQHGWLAGDLLPELFRVHLDGMASQFGRLWMILATGTGLLIVGLVDDVRGLGWPIRLGLQTVAAMLMVWQGWQMTLFFDWPFCTAVLSVLWIVGLINSFNMLDNMDGLSSGVAAIAAAILAGVMLTTPGQPQLFVAGLLLVLLGALLGFLRHNRFPACLFMGDAGSYWIGFLLAVITLMATFAGEQTPRHAILAPLCVLAVPLYDTASVIGLRLLQGHSPFVGDRRHFSHRLVALGLSEKHAVWTIYLATATCGLGACLLHQVNLIGAIVVGLMVVCVLALVAVLEIAAGRRLAERSTSEGEIK